MLSSRWTRGSASLSFKFGVKEVGTRCPTSVRLEHIDTFSYDVFTFCSDLVSWIILVRVIAFEATDCSLSG